MPPVTPRSTRAMPGCLALVRVLDFALGDFLEGHRQVVLRAGLHERRRIVVEGAFAELVVVVVDLTSALGRDDDERIARINVLEQVVDAGIDHCRVMVAAGTRSPRTSSVSSPTARSRSSFSITRSNRAAT